MIELDAYEKDLLLEGIQMLFNERMERTPHVLEDINDFTAELRKLKAKIEGEKNHGA